MFQTLYRILGNFSNFSTLTACFKANTECNSSLPLSEFEARGHSACQWACHHCERAPLRHLQHRLQGDGHSGPRGLRGQTDQTLSHAVNH